jgi:hypothetical protein
MDARDHRRELAAEIVADATEEDVIGVEPRFRGAPPSEMGMEDRSSRGDRERLGNRRRDGPEVVSRDRPGDRVWRASVDEIHRAPSCGDAGRTHKNHGDSDGRTMAKADPDRQSRPIRNMVEARA